MANYNFINRLKKALKMRAKKQGETQIEWNGQTFWTKATPDMIKTYQAYKHDIVAHKPGSKEIFFLDSTSVTVIK